MTTPQMTLQNIEYNLKRLVGAFYRECEDEDENPNYCLFDDVIKISNDQKKIIEEMQRLNDTMTLILRILNK